MSHLEGSLESRCARARIASAAQWLNCQRPLASGDEAAIAAWFKGLGPETRYARFLAGVNRFNDRTRSELARVDHRDREALTAVAALRHGANRRTRVAGIGSAAYRKGTARAIP